MSVTVTCFGGAGEIGGNKILVEDGEKRLISLPLNDNAPKTIRSRPLGLLLCSKKNCVTTCWRVRQRDRC